MKKRCVIIKGPDELDILSAIWILSCNDENPIITYEGLKYRLSLPDEYNIKSLIQNRGELFRPCVPAKRLDEWKEQMKAGKHLPSWIKEITDKATRDAKIDEISREDVFRNQFRTKTSAGPAPINIIQWGLEHIDRLRKAGIEAREEKTKKITSMLIPSLSMLVAFIAVVSGAFLQYRNIGMQVDLKKYETSFRPKQEGYESFMKSILTSFDGAYQGNNKLLKKSLSEIEIAYYKLQPFLDQSGQYEIWDEYQRFQTMCWNLTKEPTKSLKRDNYLKPFLLYKKYFSSTLYESLFKHDKIQ